MFQFFKEIYLTAFTIFFRTGGAAWTPGINAGKGVVGVAMIEWLVLIGLVSWIEVLVGTRFLLGISKWATIIVFLALCAANHYPLVARGHGTAFEREFASLQKSRKILLLVFCAIIIGVAIAFFVYTAQVHRAFVNHS